MQFVSGVAPTHDAALELLAIPVDVAVAAKNRALRRQIRLAVEAGRTYEIHFDPDLAQSR